MRVAVTYTVTSTLIKRCRPSRIGNSGIFDLISFPALRVCDKGRVALDDGYVGPIDKFKKWAH